MLAANPGRFTPADSLRQIHSGSFTPTDSLRPTHPTAYAPTNVSVIDNALNSACITITGQSRPVRS